MTAYHLSEQAQFVLNLSKEQAGRDRGQFRGLQVKIILSLVPLLPQCITGLYQLTVTSASPLAHLYTFWGRNSAPSIETSMEKQPALQL